MKLKKIKGKVGAAKTIIEEFRALFELGKEALQEAKAELKQAIPVQGQLQDYSPVEAARSEEPDRPEGWKPHR